MKKNRKTFWYWLKYSTRRNDGKIKRTEFNLDLWGDEFAKVRIFQGKTELTSEYISKLGNFSWIERL